MRNEFAAAIVKAKAHHEQLIFITGDLGYMALENVQKTFREHFINAGVAEQNMITMAAGLAHEGFIPFVYSIAPFIVLRPYEQIRNDVCLHHLPVKLVGNGGGYGYGIMGATHHTLEDIGAMRMLPNMKVYVPLVSEDVEQAVMKMIQDNSPNYLRLNFAAKFENEIPPFAPWRHLKKGKGATVVGTGPVIQNVVNFYPDLDYWYAGILPISGLPEQLLASAEETKKVIVVEEHYGEGGLRETLSFHLLNALRTPISMLSLFASGYPSGKYGSQQWHQEENSLAGASMKQKIQNFLAGSA
jgi:transketolase